MTENSIKAPTIYTAEQFFHNKELRRLPLLRNLRRWITQDKHLRLRDLVEITFDADVPTDIVPPQYLRVDKVTTGTFTCKHKGGAIYTTRFNFKTYEVYGDDGDGRQEQQEAS